MLRPPFEHWPIEFYDPRFGYAWYCGEGRIVAHVTSTHGTAAAAHVYHDYESRVLEEHADDVRRHDGIFVIHDWRAMKTYDAAGRHAWQARMRAKPKGYLRGSVVCLVKATPLLKMAVQAVNLYASVTHGAKVEISVNLHAVLRQNGLGGTIPG